MKGCKVLSRILKIFIQHEGSQEVHEKQKIIFYNLVEFESTRFFLEIHLFVFAYYRHLTEPP